MDSLEQTCSLPFFVRRYPKEWFPSMLRQIFSQAESQAKIERYDEH
jgi:hypothetical protein